MAESAVRLACHALKARAADLVDAIIEGWRHQAEAQPWLTLPDRITHDHLPDLLDSLAEAALCSLQDESSRRRLVERAAQHGIDRHAEGFAEELLYREYHLLRTYLWGWIRREWGTLPDVQDVILLLDAAITLSTSASLRGYHRAVLEEQGRWPRVLDELVNEYWPMARV